VDPDRLAGLGTLPVAGLAVVRDEIVHCVTELGLLGVELSSEGYFRFVDSGDWSAVRQALGEIGAWLLVHPQDDALERRRGVRGRLAIGGVSMVTETALVAVDMMRQGGPGPSPKIVLAHGGGTVPYVLARMDRLWETTDARADLDERPSVVFRNSFFVDSSVHDGAALAMAAAAVGPDRVLYGSDYPFVIAVTQDVIRDAGLQPPEDPLWRNAHAHGIIAWPKPAGA
jgi:aminocarboxymuconate-semialdehyde decarboxylase